MTAETGTKAMPAPMPSSYLIPEQIAVLLAPIKPHRVGRDGKGFSHVEAYELRAHLNRILGFARWSEDVLEQDCVFEESAESGGKRKWTVCYRSLVRLTVCAPDGTTLASYTEGATGEATNQPSRADAHDLALKSSASQAFKRCCMNLGDSFGLSLYRKGSLEALVKVTLVNGQGGAAGQHDGDLQDAAPVTFRPPDPEPDPQSPGAAAAQGAAPGPEVPADAPPSPPPPEAGGAHPGKSAQDYADELTAATDKPTVISLMRNLELVGLGGEQVADGNGEVTELRVLAGARLKAVRS